MFPFITIITPIFNASSYLNKAIDSVVQQETQNWELLAINDCSTDDSLKVLQNVQQQDQRIKIIDLKENRGQGYARNLALKKAQGDYVLFLDADDYFSKDAFEKLIKYIKKKPKSDVFVWGFSIFQTEKEKRKVYLPQKPNKTKEENPFELGLLNRCGFLSNPWVYVVKRSLIEKHTLRFSEGIYFEDIAFTTSLLFHTKKVRVLPFVGYHYRRHPLSVTGRSSKQKIDDKFTAFIQIKSFLEDKGAFQPYQSLYLARFLCFCVFTCFVDYFSLSKKERDQELDQYMLRIRKSKLLRNENLLLLRSIGLSLSKDKEKNARKAYLSAYAGLYGIKNRFHLQRFLTRLFLRLNRLKI